MLPGVLFSFSFVTNLVWGSAIDCSLAETTHFNVSTFTELREAVEHNDLAVCIYLLTNIEVTAEMTIAVGKQRGVFPAEDVGNVELVGSLCSWQSWGTASCGWRLFSVFGTLELESLTIKNFQSTQSKGAIINWDTLTCTNCNFVGNAFRDDGGAIYNAGSLVCTRCTFDSNTVDFYGGAIYTLGDAYFERSLFISNGAGSAAGGAIRVRSGTVTLTHSTLSQNGGPDDIYVDSDQSSFQGLLYLWNTTYDTIQGPIADQGSVPPPTTTITTITTNTNTNTVTTASVTTTATSKTTTVTTGATNTNTNTSTTAITFTTTSKSTTITTSTTNTNTNTTATVTTTTASTASITMTTSMTSITMTTSTTSIAMTTSTTSITMTTSITSITMTTSITSTSTLLTATTSSVTSATTTTAITLTATTSVTSTRTSTASTTTVANKFVHDDFSIVEVFNEDSKGANKLADIHKAFDGDTATWSYLTPSGVGTSLISVWHLVAFSVPSGRMVKFVRVAKYRPDRDHPHFNTFKFTTDAVVSRESLRAATWIPVSGLRNGCDGQEQNVVFGYDVFTGVTEEKRPFHDFGLNGWYCYSFESVVVSGFAIGFMQDCCTHMKLAEVELGTEPLTTATQTTTITFTSTSSISDTFTSITSTASSTSFLVSTVAGAITLEVANPAAFMASLNAKLSLRKAIASTAGGNVGFQSVNIVLSSARRLAQDSSALRRLAGQIACSYSIRVPATEASVVFDSLQNASVEALNDAIILELTNINEANFVLGMSVASITVTKLAATPHSPTSNTLMPKSTTSTGATTTPTSGALERGVCRGRISEDDEDCRGKTDEMSCDGACHWSDACIYKPTYNKNVNGFNVGSCGGGDRWATTCKAFLSITLFKSSSDGRCGEQCQAGHQLRSLVDTIYILNLVDMVFCLISLVVVIGAVVLKHIWTKWPPPMIACTWLISGLLILIDVCLQACALAFAIMASPLAEKISGWNCLDTKANAGREMFKTLVAIETSLKSTMIIGVVEAFFGIAGGVADVTVIRHLRADRSTPAGSMAKASSDTSDGPVDARGVYLGYKETKALVASHTLWIVVICLFLDFVAAILDFALFSIPAKNSSDELFASAGSVESSWCFWPTMDRQGC
eukprot:TRINITY_DN13627_c0_g1_i2.p1 TRINITY_DN13627_c0_g1~~TRINITY_DN13627_c0_g1_i2.p1  ORF type:complete len:1134 (-),score=127.71 TRINITY_DN13627_c0_g1_i2:221-3622(-)